MSGCLMIFVFFKLEKKNNFILHKAHKIFMENSSLFSTYILKPYSERDINFISLNYVIYNFDDI